MNARETSCGNWTRFEVTQDGAQCWTLMLGVVTGCILPDNWVVPPTKWRVTCSETENLAIVFVRTEL
jgi:hypothetical protein